MRRWASTHRRHNDVVVHDRTTGATPALIGDKPSQRDLTTSARRRDTVIASDTTGRPASSGSDLAPHALALDAALEIALTTNPHVQTPGCPCGTPRQRCSTNGSCSWQAEPGHLLRRRWTRSHEGRLRPETAMGRCSRWS